MLKDFRANALLSSSCSCIIFRFQTAYDKGHPSKCCSSGLNILAFKIVSILI